MVERHAQTLGSLYEQDETAWLEQTSELVAQRRFDDVDVQNLTEYLRDMAKRDKREVLSGLKLLLSNMLMWEFQPGHRSSSWRNTIVDQQEQLSDLLESGSLRRHAEEVLEKAYKHAVQHAASETGLPTTTFPVDCPHTLDELLLAGG